MIPGERAECHEQAHEPRTLSRLTGADAGPTVVCVAAIHGNERAGIEAVRRVAASVRRLARGEWVAVLGNRTASARGVRFIDRDLNRHWSRSALTRHPRPAVEDREQRELGDAFTDIMARARGAIYLLDLHTTSAPGGPFTVFADTLRSRAAAQRLPIPMLLGLDEHLDGTLVDYMAGLGHAAVAVEGGQHGDPNAVANLEAAIQLFLAATGLIRAPCGPLAEARGRLREASRGVPHALRIRFRHPVGPQDGFRMHGGFASFDRVRRRQLLACDRRGEILAPHAGSLVMPLYQDLGNDGFFIARPVWKGGLVLSRWLRTAGADRFVPHLPGIGRTTEPGVFVVNRRVARWGALELLHLLGYRREREAGRLLLVRRRKDGVS